MYYYNSAYTTYNYAAGALGILVVAVVLTALLLVLVLPKQKDGHLPAFFQLLYDLFTPKALMIEKLLQVLYVFLNCLTVLFGIAIFFNGFFAGFGRIVLGLVILATTQNELLCWIGVGMIAMSALFSLITLPVEYNASARALEWLQTSRTMEGAQLAQAREALSWAARTYLVAALSAIASVLYYVLLILGGRRD